MRHGCPYKLKSAHSQARLAHARNVDVYKSAMLAGEWDWVSTGVTFVYWLNDNVLCISDGHHRANAAIEIGRQTGDWTYLEKLLAYGSSQPGSIPASAGHFPTRTLLSRLLQLLKDWLP